MTWGELKRPLSLLSKLLAHLYRLISYIPPLKLHSWVKIFVSQLKQILKGEKFITLVEFIPHYD